jgi:anaerobic ribonucleoside-triphosphate reductase
MSIDNIKKRSGELVPFDRDKITHAVYKCLQQVDHESIQDAEKITKKVDKRVTKFVKEHGKDFIPNVEEVQDFVEFELMKAGFFEAAKSYILYRDHKSQERRRDIFK